MNRSLALLSLTLSCASTSYAGDLRARYNQESYANNGEGYTYDGLHRLKTFRRGYPIGISIVTLKFAQTWNLDQLGNWEEFDQDDNGNSTWDLEQQRYHNDVNEIDGNSGDPIALQSGGAGSNWADPVHDAAGNMTTIPQPLAPRTPLSTTPGIALSR